MCTPEWQGGKIACNMRINFLPHLSGLTYLSGVPHLYVNKPQEGVEYVLRCINHSTKRANNRNASVFRAQDVRYAFNNGWNAFPPSSHASQFRGGSEAQPIREGSARQGYLFQA